MNRIMKRAALPVGAALILGSSGFAFMATNTGLVSAAGNGSNVISGYNVTDIHYKLVPDAFSPFEAGQESIQRVTFTLDKPATTVRAYVNDKVFPVCGTPTANAGGTFTWTCDQPNAGFGVLVQPANTLAVVAAS